MKNRTVGKRALLLLTVVNLGIFGLLYAFQNDLTKNRKEFVIEEELFLDNLPSDIKQLRIWLPYPAQDKWQSVKCVNLSGDFEIYPIKDPKNGNTFLYLVPKQGLERLNKAVLSLTFLIERSECGLDNEEPVSYRQSGRFLKPDKFVPVNKQIKTLAQDITKGKYGELEKARAVYDYIIDELTYSNDDPNICGIGNSMLTLKHKKGICTDYHSLFMSLVRSLGIPAKFEIGYRIPAETQEGELKGYHCWVKIYIRGKGWMPVDVSEADKHPQKRDYYFGHIDENRVKFTAGRDIRLRYSKEKSAFNFFIYPFAELNGKRFSGIHTNLFFKSVKADK